MGRSTIQFRSRAAHPRFFSPSSLLHSFTPYSALEDRRKKNPPTPNEETGSRISQKYPRFISSRNLRYGGHELECRREGRDQEARSVFAEADGSGGQVVRFESRQATGDGGPGSRQRPA